MRNFPLTRLMPLSSLTLLTTLAATVAQASPATTGLGLKQDLIPPADPATTNQLANSSANPGTTMLQIMVALGIVYFLLKFALPKLIAKYGKNISAPADSDIRIHETASFGAGQLQVISVRGKILLLGITNAGINTLADLTDAPDPGKSKEPAFFELLDKAKEQPTPNLASKAAIYLAQDEESTETESKEDTTKINHKQASAKKVYKESAEQTQPKTKPQSANAATPEELDLQARLARLAKLVEEAN